MDKETFFKNVSYQDTDITRLIYDSLVRWNNPKEIIPCCDRNVLIKGFFKSTGEVFIVVGNCYQGTFDYDYSYNDPEFEILGWREIFE